MGNMHKRIALVRKDNNLSQAAFGKKLGVSRDVISNIEYNRVTPKQLFIDHLCKVCKVNKEWLMTGTGQMYSVPEEDLLLARALADIASSENSTVHTIVSKLTKLDEEHLDLVLNLITALSKK